MMHRYLSSLLSVRTIATTGLIAAFVAFYLSTLRGLPNVNTWDALFPAVTETSTICLIGLLWWCSFLIPYAHEFDRPETMIRMGSDARAVGVFLRDASCSLAAGATALTALIGVLWIFGGVTTAWSPAAVAPVTSQITPSAFSAVALARHFSSPLGAIVASGVFTIIAFLVVAALFLAVAARIGSRPAVWALMAFYVWAAFGSFVVVPGLGVSGLFSLPWALDTGGLLIPTFVLICLCCVTGLLMFANSFTPRRWVTSRAAITTALCVLAALGAWGSGATAGNMPDAMSIFLGGRFGDLEQYALTAVLPLGYGLGYASRLADRSSGLFWGEVLRRGSYRRWTAASLGVETAYTAVFALAVTVVAGASVGASTHFAGASTPATWQLLARAFLGFWVETALVCSLAMILFWLSSTVTAWVGVAVASLALGYPIILDLGPLNIFSPFSIEPDTHAFGPIVPLIAAAIVVLALVAAILIRSSHPRGPTLRTP